jgi:hypothetical protein
VGPGHLTGSLTINYGPKEGAMRSNPTAQPDEDEQPAGGRDAMSDEFVFEYQGDEWSMTHPGSVDYRDAEAADGGDAEAVRVVIATAMGAERDPETREFHGEQWDEFDKLVLPTVGLDRLFRAWLAYYGVNPGELPGSAARFGATAVPSNRRSRRTGSNSPRSSRRAAGATSRR